MVSGQQRGIFANPVSGIGYNVVSTRNLTVAPIVAYAFGRDNTGAISRFEDVDGGLVGGFKLAWTEYPLQLQADVVTPVTGDLDGVRVRGYLRYLGQLNDRVSYGFGPDITWGSSAWNRALFEVSAADSARSGVATYKADGSFVRPGVNGRLTYSLTSQVSVSGIARYSRITGNAADSPIVDELGDASQWFGSIVVDYKF